MIGFLKEERGDSAIDWTLLSAGVLSLAVAIAADVYFAALALAS